MIYALYAAVVVGILVCGYVLRQYQRKILGLLMLVHVPEITSGFQDPELAMILQQRTVIEHAKHKFITVPFAALCATAAICVPFYFQTEIPISVEIGMAAAIGWLFTYVIRKDFEPAWYSLTHDLISTIIVERLATTLIDQFEKTPTESAQSPLQE